MQRLAVRLLGGLEIRMDGEPVTGLAAGKTSLLLAYLAMEQQTSHSRESLAALFWPDLPAEAARRNLRQALYYIRSYLETDSGEPVVLADRERVRFNAESEHWLDVSVLMEASEQCPHYSDPRSWCSPCLERLRNAADCYRGELLAGVLWPEDMEEVGDWLQARRERLHRHTLALLERLTHHYEQRGEPQRALRYAHRYTELDPLSEGGHANLMRLLALTGQPNAALAQYESCQRLLDRELGVSPGPDLDRLAEDIRAGRVHSAGPSHETAETGHAQRRFLVALACRYTVDLQDPEDQAELLHPFLSAARTTLQDWGGFQEGFQGGGLIAYFGFPEPDEHAVIRAAEAARSLLGRGRDLGVQVSAGIHAGTSVYSPSAGQPDADGLLAQEALRWAERGDGEGVRLSPAAASAARQRYQLAPLTSAPLPGGGQIVGDHRGPAPGPPLTPEARRQLAALQAAGTEPGACHLLVGPPRSGKTRLLAELVQHTDLAFLQGRCEPWHRDTRGAGLRPMVAQALGLDPEEADGEWIREAAEDRGLDGPTLALPFEGDAEGWGPFSRALARLLEATPWDGLIMEDLQWADPLTAGLLDAWAAGQLPSPGPVVATTRSALALGRGWPTVRLGAESATAIHQLLQEAYGRQLGSRAREEIVRRAEGNPGLALDLAREKGRSGHELPPDFLLRIQQQWQHLGRELATGREAAAWGEPHTAGELATAVGRPFEQVAQDLESLGGAGLLTTGTDNRYRFSSALAREALYETLPRSERRSLHRGFARFLEGETDTATAEAVARHYSLAGEPAVASEYWLEAARHSLASGHPARAADQARRGLRDNRQPGSEQQSEHVRSLWLMLGQAEMAARGPLAPAAGRALYRAHLGCGQSSRSAPVCFQAGWGLWLRTMAESGHPSARAVAHDRLQPLAHMAPNLRPAADLAAGTSAFWLGRLGEAAHYLRLAMSPAAETALVTPPPEERTPAIAARGYLGLAWWQLGFPTQAQELAHRARELAEQEGTRSDRIAAGSSLALLHLQCGEAEPAVHYARESAALAEAADRATQASLARVLTAWGEALYGEIPSTSQLWKDCETLAENGGGLGTASAAWAGEALLRADKPAAAEEILSTGLERAAAMGERASLPDLYRLQGRARARLEPAQPEAAEVWLQRALDTARNQGAPALALRCALALGVHWLGQGRSSEARGLVAGYLRDLPQARHTADGQAAHQLLQTPHRFVG